jgi:hypothetical protein
MRLFTYALCVDDGAAPNPYGGVCTLTICKPVIRRTAEVGDWILGFGPTDGPEEKNLSDHVVYAMRVSQKLPLAAYDAHCRTGLTAKLPDWSARAPFEHQVGDCIYEPLPGGGFRQRLGVHKAGNMPVDLRGEYSLLAEEVFYYFGDKAVKLPERFASICHPYQGHKVSSNEPFKQEVVRWLLKGLDRDARPRILYGRPMHQKVVVPGSDRPTWGSCATREDIGTVDEGCAIC